MHDKSNSAASDVDLVRFDLRMIRDQQSSAGSGTTAECVAEHSPAAVDARHRLVAIALARTRIRRTTKGIVSDRAARAP